MLPITLLLILWTPAMVGLGWPLLSRVRRATGGRVGGVARRTAVAGLLGIFITATVSSAIGLALPVRPGLSIAVLVAGWAVVICRRRVWSRLPRQAWMLPLGWVAIVVLIDARGMPWYDTGLYHLQAVAWAGDGPLPRGLANLQDRLGFNCACFAFAPVIEFPFAKGQASFIANALLIALAGLPALDSTRRLRRGDVRADDVVFTVALFPLAEYAGRHGMVSSLAPDLIVMTLVPFAAALWVRSPRNALLAVVLATLAVTVKLSAAPLVGAAAIAAIAGWRSVRRPGLAWAIVAMCAAAGGVWVVRGIWLSGCPLFPSTLGRMGSVSWAIPATDARYAERAITDWARYHLDSVAVTPGKPWFAGWIRRVGCSAPIVVPIVIALLGVTGLIFRRRSEMNRRAIAAAVALLPAIAFWFVTAPDPRFGVGFLSTVASLVLATTLRGRQWSVRCGQVAVGLFVVVLIVVVRPDHRLFKVAIARWPTIPVAKLVVRHAADGTAVSMPVGDDRVWAAPRLATPDLNPTLRCVRDADGRFSEFEVDRPRALVLPGD